MHPESSRNRVYHFTTVARPENLPRVADFLTKTLRILSVDGRTAFDVQLAVDEACANVIEHAHADSEPGPILLRVSQSGSELVVRLRDSGRPFDPTQVPPPDLRATIDERKEGGLGLAVMRRVMDRVEYHPRPGLGNELVMTKVVRNEKK